VKSKSSQAWRRINEAHYAEHQSKVDPKLQELVDRTSAKPDWMQDPSRLPKRPPGK
jgi:hypothetical protein